METPRDTLPYLTTDQMREVDRAMIEDYGIELIQMMENAGRCLAHVARVRFLGGDPRGKKVVVLSGTGGNGGGGLVCARRLYNWGAQVTVVTTKADAHFAGVPAHQLSILRRMKVPVKPAGELLDPKSDLLEVPSADVVVDAVIGYSLLGPPHGFAARLIQWAERQEAPILSLDTPSGMDTATGRLHEPSIRADATMTLALPKAGFRASGAKDAVGELYLADISVPPGLYAGSGLGLHVDSPFAREDVIRLTRFQTGTSS